MARLPDEQIQRLKQEVSLLGLVQSQGYKVEKQGKDYVVSCPFHDDKTPSCIISPKSNLFHCFGCDAGGSVIDWVIKTRQLNFREAVVWLQNHTLPIIAPTHPASAMLEHPCSSAAKPSLAASESLNPECCSELAQDTAHTLLDFYHQCLLENEEARAYLQQRGLNDEALIKHFKLGVGERRANDVLASRRSRAGKEQLDALKAMGLLLDSCYERFNGSLVVPVINENIVKEVYGRRIAAGHQRKHPSSHHYLPGPHRGIWNKDGIENQTSIILCESLIDAMTLWVHGFTHVTTSYGASGFTDEHLAFFISRAPEYIYIAYDRDEAGERGAKKVLETLAANNLHGVRLSLPPNTDINEWALKENNFTEAFNTCLLNASTQHPSPLAADSLVAESVETPTAIESKTINKPANELTAKGDDWYLTRSERTYRIRGLAKNTNAEQLKINLMLNYGELFYVDALDLYQAKQRQQFTQHASVECGLESDVIKKDLGVLLRQLEEVQENNLQAFSEHDVVELSEEEKTEALALLKDKNLLQRIIEDFTRCGVVGESTNTLVGYLAGVSRKLDKPLAVMIQSTSAAGKSSVMDAVLNMMPKDERVQYSAMTGQSLYYLGETNLKHKILAISEEEGAENASYALKLLQSEGEITIASTGKNNVTGNLETQSYHVEGPVMLFLTTTAIDIDEELLNRCLVLTVNESQAQTEAIHAQQRFADTLEGLLAKENKQQVMALHHNAQRLLKSLHVVNPFAEQLSFLSHKTRTRRDHQKYLTLIKSVALLHQYQRPTKTIEYNGEMLHYIEVAEKDIEIANQLASDVLGRTLDELPPQTRKLLQLVYDYVQKQLKEKKIDQQDLRFTRREIREFTGWGNTQLKIHCQRLEDMEYLLIHQGGRGQPLRYQLLYDGQGQYGEAFYHGLRRVKQEWSGVNGQRSGSSRPQVGGVSGPSRAMKNGVKATAGVVSDLFANELPENNIVLENKNGSVARV